VSIITLPNALDGRHLALVKSVFPKRIGLWVTKVSIDTTADRRSKVDAE